MGSRDGESREHLEVSEEEGNNPRRSPKMGKLMITKGLRKVRC